MFKKAFWELKQHAPFTFAGALIGVLAVLLFKNISEQNSFTLFYIFHPAHVLLSAFVTASMYKLNKKNPRFIEVFLVGYVGSIVISTMSDSIMPYLGETLLNLPHRELHLGFIEKWYVVDSIAILGVLLAWLKPSTKIPHSAHIFASTSASLLHIVMSLGTVVISSLLLFEITFVLFLSVWLPCCFSDIIFPILFTKECDCKH